MAGAGICNDPQTTSPPPQRWTSSPTASSPYSFSSEESPKQTLNHPFIQTSPRKPLPIVPNDSSARIERKPLSPIYGDDPSSPVSGVSPSRFNNSYAISAPLDNEPSKGLDRTLNSSGTIPIIQSLPYRQRQTAEPLDNIQQPQTAKLSSKGDWQSSSPSMNFSNDGPSHSRNASSGSVENLLDPNEAVQPLHYHHQYSAASNGLRIIENRASQATIHSSTSDSPTSSSADDHAGPSKRHLAPVWRDRLGPTMPRPSSAFSSASDLGARGRERSPQLSPNQYARAPSANSRRSPDSRPISYVDLLNVPYPQPPPAPANLDHAHLRTAVGTNASLLSTGKTLEMYRANVKKTNDPAIQYEFAIFMVNTAQEVGADGLDEGIERQPSPMPGKDLESSYNDIPSPSTKADLLREARSILQRLSDRSYPFAQYYLADGYASGLFNKGTADNDRSFPLFVAASKHGHAEAGYRAALCYEFGWGTRKDPQKAVQFYRQSASKNHPGAMSRLGRACLAGDMGLGNRHREGLKWLKRAAESADFQYNSAPYELGLLHETGYGDDIFQDESYTAQLFTQSADLGHMEANYRLGDAYEHGKLTCPRDPALSVHFYNGAAQQGHPQAMMALCAWYMVGAEPILEKDENEAYEWAKKSAEAGT